MTTIGLISFDLWSTLVRANAAYQRRRVELVAAAMGRRDLAAVRAAIESAAGAFDDRTERTGEQYGFVDRVLRVRELLHAPEMPGDQLDALAEAMGRAFVEYPPALMEPTLLETLAGLRHRGLRIAVTSNTGFVPGRLLHTALGELGVLPLTDHLFFSDEVRYAKPSTMVFQHLVRVGGGRPDQVLHVGDNRIADYEGALAAGLRALWYRPGGEPGEGILLRHRDLLDHPLMRPALAIPRQDRSIVNAATQTPTQTARPTA
jgi:putative hydrolase of the HAD superfamily